MAKTAAERYELFPAAELVPGEIRSVEVSGLAIAIVCTPEGDVYGLRDVCPHHGARLSLGYVDRAVESDAVGEFHLSEDCAVRCPWHGYEFSASTGRSLADPQRIRVRSYRVAIENDTVVLWR